MSGATPEGGRAPAPPGRLARFAAARLDPTSSLGLHLTVGLAAFLLALWAFGALLEEVLDDATMVRLDVAADAWIHAHATPGGLRLFDAVTQFGSPAVMGLAAVVGAVLLWRTRHRLTLVTWVAAFAGGALVDQVLKVLVHRARPAYGAAYLHGHSYSFPSGHAMGSIIGYAMIVIALRRHVPAARRHVVAVSVAAAVCVLAIGASRLYLGVHYPSDVVGGWAAGAVWLAVCLTAASVARGRRGAAMAPDAAR